MAVIRDELVLIRDQYADARRTEIQTDHSDLTLEDMITPEEMVVTLSHAGYAKAQPLSQYQAQKRGGKGRSATATKDEDFIDKLFVANALDTVLCFSSLGKVYWIKVYELPQAGRAARGRPMVNLLPLGEGERINAFLPVREYDEGHFVFMATTAGTVKKTPLLEFSRPLSRGIIALDLHGDERLVDVAITDGEREILLFSSAGKAVRFRETEVRSMGRGAHGVRGILLDEGQRVIAMLVVDPACTVLGVTENGYGKRTPVEDFPTKGRGTKGVIAIGASARNGATRWVPCWYCPRMRSCSLPWVAPWCAPPWHRSPPLAAPPRASSSSASARASAWRAWNVFLPWKGAPRKAKKVAKARTRAPRARSWLEGAGARRAICLTTL
jgi:DNA gyrase subunit A